MLLNHQQRKILELLCKTEHVTASELAGQLGIGVKTVRVRIKELNPELEKKGIDRKSTRLNSSHVKRSRMPSSA